MKKGKAGYGNNGDKGKLPKREVRNVGAKGKLVRPKGKSPKK